MPRLGYETPCQPDRRSPSERDRFLFVIKFAAFVVAVGLVGGFYLLSGEPSSEEDGRSAAVAAPSTSPSTKVAIAPPAVGTMTAQIVPPSAPPPVTSTARPPASTPAPPPPPAPDRRFAVVDEPCPQPGMFSLTSRYEPVVCRDGAWKPVDLGN